MSPVELALSVGETSLRASVALAIVLALHRLLAGRSSAGLRRALLLGAVLAVPLLPAGRAALPGLAIDWPASVDHAASAALVDVSMEGPPPTVPMVLAAVWLLGAVAMLTRLGAGLAGASRRARSSRTLDAPDWLAARNDLAAGLGLRRPPAMRVTERETVPVAWGVLRPVILVPPSALRWSAARRRAVLAHEIGHIARREPLSRIAVELVRAVHWFDPLLRRVVGRLRRESELAADEVALGLGIDPRDYADHLVALARQRLAPERSRAAAPFASDGELERRVEAILAAGARGVRPPALRGRSALAVATLALGIVLGTAVPRLGSDPALAVRLAARYDIPVALAGEILASAGREGIDPGVAFGLVAEESGFDPRRVSRGGAVGLTQVLPATARGVDPGITSGELRDPSANLRIGFRYLRRQIEREGGDVSAGLLAYAIGPRRLEELRRAGAPIPDDYSTRILAHAH